MIKKRWCCAKPNKRGRVSEAYTLHRETEFTSLHLSGKSISTRHAHNIKKSAGNQGVLSHKVHSHNSAYHPSPI